jgi:hypothetical protein
MKLHKVTNLLAIAATTLCLIPMAGQQASAGQLYNGWNYGIDSFTDGSGGEGYNIRGLAVKETSDSIYVALTSGMPLAGNSYSAAADGNIGWGDLFFNFSGKDFKTASNEGSLFGVRFAATNDSKVATTGVYKNVQATSVALDNSGYSSLQQYYDHGWESTNTQGTDFSTKAAAFDYFGTGAILNVINSGTKIGDVTTLTASALSALGLDFNNFSASGSQTFGIKFDKSLLPNGSYVSNLFFECGNDGVSLKGTTSVPEPSEVMGLAVIGLVLVGGGSQLRKGRKAIAQ